MSWDIPRSGSDHAPGRELVDLDTLPLPIVQAPMAGGASTPELAVAVSRAGGLGFLAAGYRAPPAVAEEIAGVQSATDRPFGVNLFVPSWQAGDPERVVAYAERLDAEARRYGVAPGQPRFDDDGWAEKLAIVCAARVAVVSFTFGCPEPEVLERVRGSGASAWVTVTDEEEARIAAAAGADALVVQGLEAGGHRASFRDEDGAGLVGLLALLRLVAHVTPLPMVASGGIADGAGVAASLCGGARAAQVGTALMRSAEAATTPVHRGALGRPGTTELTRAFTGRRARGLTNRFHREHAAAAPRAYPEVHHLTAPLRAAARAAEDPDGFNLWAGQAHVLAEEAPAAELVARWAAEARGIVLQVAGRLGPPPRSAQQAHDRGDPN